MHVDAFRFDLASILAQDETGLPLENPPVLWDIEWDPVLAGTKLIAEAWGCRRSLSGRNLHRRQLEGVEWPVPRRHPQVCEGGQKHGALANAARARQPRQWMRPPVRWCWGRDTVWRRVP